MAGSKKKSTPAAPSTLEAAFLTYWRILGADRVGDPVFQFPFQQWVVDFAFPDARVAIEIDGAIWKVGGHSSGTGILRDINKNNALVEAGWVLLRYATNHIHDDPASMVDQICRVVERRLHELA